MVGRCDLLVKQYLFWGGVGVGNWEHVSFWGCIFVESLELFRTHEMLGVTCRYVFEFSTGNMSRCVYCSFTSLKPINGESCSILSSSQTQHLWQKTPVILPLNWGPRRCRRESCGEPVDRYMYSYPPGKRSPVPLNGRRKIIDSRVVAVTGICDRSRYSYMCNIFIYRYIFNMCMKPVTS